MAKAMRAAKAAKPPVTTESPLNELQRPSWLGAMPRTSPLLLGGEQVKAEQVKAGLPLQPARNQSTPHPPPAAQGASTDADLATNLYAYLRQGSLPQELVRAFRQESLTHLNDLTAFLRYGCPEVAGFQPQTARSPFGKLSWTSGGTWQCNACGRKRGIDAFKRELRARIYAVPGCAYAKAALDSLAKGIALDMACTQCVYTAAMKVAQAGDTTGAA